VSLTRISRSRTRAKSPRWSLNVPIYHSSTLSSFSRACLRFCRPSLARGSCGTPHLRRLHEPFQYQVKRTDAEWRIFEHTQKTTLSRMKHAALCTAALALPSLDDHVRASNFSIEMIHRLQESSSFCYVFGLPIEFEFPSALQFHDVVNSRLCPNLLQSLHARLRS
jgi:hypothetical protein